MFSDNGLMRAEISEHNLAALSGEQSLECEKRVLELYELASAAANAAGSLYTDGFGIYDMLEALFDVDDSPIPPHSEILEINRHRIESYMHSLSSNDKAVFSELFSERLTERGITLAESDFLSGGGEGENIVYVKNRLADEAYDVFAENFRDPRVFYAKDFREAAAAVAEGNAEYCLLPLEEKGGARIPSISALLYAKDLKINMVTPVFGFDGSAEMKYALVSRHFSVPEITDESDRYLEIRLTENTPKSLSELFSAACQLGVSVYRINTSVFSSDEGDEPCITVVFEKTGGSFTQLLVYLTLFVKSYTAVGIYDNLE